METDSNPEFSIVIDYDDYLTRFDLDEILSSIDGIIEDELLSVFDPDYYFMRRRYPYPYWYRETSGLSYIGITAVDRGSIILTVIASGAVATYVARRFKKGVDKSLLAKQIERSGKMTGDVLGGALKRINDWAEKYVPEQRELGGKVKNVRVERKRKYDSQP
jgi:hypothetical protein